MKAAVYFENGGPEVLRYEEVPDPVPGVGEVLIDVEAIAIEGGDLLFRSMRRDDVGSAAPPPHCVGYSAAGTVAALGPATHGVAVGSRVATFGFSGSHASRRIVRAEHCWAVPDGLDAIRASCVPVAFGTAHEAIFEFGRLQAGQTVFVQGAAGGVALAAVQLAHRAGARVIGTGSDSRQLALLGSYGLDHAINHRTGAVLDQVLALTDGKGVDLALDPVGGRAVDDVLRATRYGGRVALIGLSSRERTAMDARLLLIRGLTMHGFMLSEHFGEPRVGAYLDALLARIAAGELEVVIDRVFPLADAAEAHRRAETHGRVGRVVMTP